MSYALCIDPSCQKAIKRLTKKDPLLQNILEKKITEILENTNVINHYVTTWPVITGCIS